MWQMSADRLPMKKNTSIITITDCLQLGGGPHTQSYELNLTKEQDLERNERGCCAACLQCNEEG